MSDKKSAITLSGAVVIATAATALGYAIGKSMGPSRSTVFYDS